jgi:hypothetical protein
MHAMAQSGFDGDCAAQETPPMPTTDTAIPASQNQAWGFFGTISQSAEPRAAWDIAFRAISAATKCEPWEVRAFLDSRYGRHFADEVEMNMPRNSTRIDDAIAPAVAKWMGWKITKRDVDQIGDGARGLAYLTAYVVAAGIEDEANG